MASAEIGIILRHDLTMREHGFSRVTVDTPSGPVERVFLGSMARREVAFLYGRFKGNRVPSRDIDFVQNQEVWNVLGVKTIVGTFICGGIQPGRRVGDIFVPDDLVGLGGYSGNVYPGRSFRNVDMFRPFCEESRQALLEGARASGVEVVPDGTYVSFHGWPRIETKAELDFYRAMGWSIVGQTLDPEATLARQSGCCYAALAVQIDDPAGRSQFLAGETHSRQEGRQAIAEGRDRMAAIIKASLPYLRRPADKACACAHSYTSETNHFLPMPRGWTEEP